MDPQMLMMLLQMAGSGMAAGAPSTNPASGNFMGVMGNALMGGAKGYAAGDEMRRSQDYLKAMQQAIALKQQNQEQDPLEAMRRFDPRFRQELEPQRPSLSNRMDPRYMLGNQVPYPFGIY